MFFYQTLFSGSDGNCLLVASGNTYILIDAGRNCKAILDALSANSVSIKEISAIFITHEHSDHISALDVLVKRYRIPVFANGATAAEIASKSRIMPKDLLFELEYYATAKKGDLRVTPFPLPHDSVACSGYMIESEGKRLVAATDMGSLSGDFASVAKDADALLIESNYDKAMLFGGKYPEYLKRRISSDFGHLSNGDCAEAVSVLCKRKARKVLLAHLSKENNTPEKAVIESETALKKAGATITGDPENQKSDVFLMAAPRYTPSPRIII